jgi:hypothetical protein
VDKGNLINLIYFWSEFSLLGKKILKKNQWNSYKGFLWKKCTKSCQILRGKALKLPY